MKYILLWLQQSIRRIQSSRDEMGSLNRHSPLHYGTYHLLEERHVLKVTEVNEYVQSLFNTSKKKV